jgi:hypothetical protein
LRFKMEHTKKVSPTIQLGAEPLVVISKKAPRQVSLVNLVSSKSEGIMLQLLLPPKLREMVTSVSQAVKSHEQASKGNVGRQLTVGVVILQVARARLGARDLVVYLCYILGRSTDQGGPGIDGGKTFAARGYAD